MADTQQLLPAGFNRFSLVANIPSGSTVIIESQCQDVWVTVSTYTESGGWPQETGAAPIRITATGDATFQVY